MSGSRPTVVQFGAGAIGRGFLGQLWTEGGFEVVYVDVAPALIDALNTRGSYPLRLADNDGVTNLQIGPVRAISALDTEAVTQEIAACTFVCTAVGANVFAQLAPVIAAGIERRTRAGGPVLNILCCENQNHAAQTLRDAVQAHLPDDPCLFAYADERTGFVDASVGRMVPPPTPELLAEDPLLILAEPYKELPIDGAAWRGPFPKVPGLQPKDNFQGYVARKLYVHNGAHALLAYLGFHQGNTFIWTALISRSTRGELDSFWQIANRALEAEYGLNVSELEAHENDLRRRFANRKLNDTVARVGRDPKRKLRADDRLVGVALLQRKHWPDREPSRPICLALAAALLFDPPEDPSADEVRAAVKAHGSAGALARFTGLSVHDPLLVAANSAYDFLSGFSSSAWRAFLNSEQNRP